MDDEMQPLPWDARDWMRHASVEGGGASGCARERQYDVLMDEIAYLIQYDDGMWNISRVKKWSI